jgi:hypothetical protein
MAAVFSNFDPNPDTSYTNRMNLRINHRLLIFCLVCMLGFSGFSNAQTIGKKSPRVELHNYNPIKEDGELIFQIDVRMADCVSHLEFSSENAKKPIQISVTENDYILSEDGDEQIYLKVALGNLKEIMKKKKELPIDLSIFSKSGKLIYSKQLNLQKETLVASLARN